MRMPLWSLGAKRRKAKKRMGSGQWSWGQRTLLLYKYEFILMKFRYLITRFLMCYW